MLPEQKRDFPKQTLQACFWDQKKGSFYNRSLLSPLHSVTSKYPPVHNIRTVILRWSCGGVQQTAVLPFVYRSSEDRRMPCLTDLKPDNQAVCKSPAANRKNRRVVQGSESLLPVRP